MKKVESRTVALRRHQLGISLLELSLTLVILGIIGVLIIRWYATSTQENEIIAARSALQRADDALLAFAAIEHRLPCPATDEEGLENCSSTSHGKLPWRTLGLPDARGAGVDYTVLRRANDTDAQLDADLASAKDRTRPLKVLQTGSGPAVYPTATGYVNGLDFCHGLRSSMRLPLDPSQGAEGNIAYAISNHSPGLGIKSTDKLKDVALSAHSPIGNDNPQNTITIGADQLWRRLDCATAFAAVNYSHFNTAVAAGVQVQSVVDLEEQLKILVAMGKANSASARAATAQAVTGVASATTGLLFTNADIQKDIANPEIKIPDVPWDITGLGLSIVAEVEAALVTAAAIAFNAYVDTAKRKAEDNYAEIRHETDGLTAKSKQMSKCLYAAAVAADARGMNQSNPAIEPEIPSCMP
jgi:type II secretory pathway pseudopilin PulG